jgi:acetyl esterase/lipase
MKNNTALILSTCLFIFLPQTWGQQLKNNSAVPTAPIEIWPGKGPGSENLDANYGTPEGTYTGDCLTENRKCDGISITTIVPFFPSKPNGTSVIICPGGSYAELSYDVEGTTIAQWLNSLNITTFILKYRLPQTTGHVNRWNVPLQDAQRAVRVIKSNAASWGLNADKVGIMGFSAGGHVAATLATKYNVSVYPRRDATDDLSARPAFIVLCYALITMTDAHTHSTARANLFGTTTPTSNQINAFSAELNVTSSTPKTFLAHSKTDSSVDYENSELFSSALNAKGVSNELHLYNSGKHGIGLCRDVTSDFHQNWTTDCQAWLNANGLLTNVISNAENKVKLSISPNPIKENGIISFTLPSVSDVEINIFDISGKKISMIKPEKIDAGLNEVPIEKGVFPSKGIYLVTLKTPYHVVSQKICHQ